MPDLLATLLAPVGAAYRGAAAVRRALYSAGALATRRSPVPVICVGNLTLGGTGKTPMVAECCRVLQAAGRRPAVVTRGYGRRTPPSQLVVVSDGAAVTATPDEGGDEPVLLARMLPGVAVVACADRARACAHAHAQGWCDCIVLDDGFQHLALARDADIVLVDATRELGAMRMFPAGTMREPVGALARATAVVHTRAPADPTDACLAANRALVAGIRPGLPQFTARFLADSLRPLGGRAASEDGATPEAGGATPLPGNGTDAPAGALAGKRVAAFAGIAQPEQFFADLRALGAEVHPIALPDHAAYDQSAIARIGARARAEQCDMAVTTAKDAVKFAPGDWPGTLPLLVLEQRVQLDPADEFRALLLRAVNH